MKEESKKKDLSYLPSIDLNCDIGQEWGIYQNDPNQEWLYPYITSANIACGGHAGDLDTIQSSIQLAKNNEWAIGAHIGYPDPKNLGRKELNMPANELINSLLGQIGMLSSIAQRYDMQITHIRPHAALTARMISQADISEKICRAIVKLYPWMALLAPYGVYLNQLHENTGIMTISELHLDRIYKKDGTRKSHAKIQNYDQAVDQAEAIIYHSRVPVEGQRNTKVSFRSIHLKTNRPYSKDLAATVHKMITNQNRLGYFHPFSQNYEVSDELQQPVEHLMTRRFL